MTGEKMWQDYCLSTNTDINTKHDTWKFCGGGEFADQLANLVLSGTKTATASTRISYETEGEELPRVGAYSVILFDNNVAACIIKNVKVSIVPFNQVSAEHAFKEGEDDRSLEKWREVHWKHAGAENQNKRGLCVSGYFPLGRSPLFACYDFLKKDV